MSRREFPGGVERRHEYLNEIGRHCDANSGRCVDKAVVEWDGFSLGPNGDHLEPQQARKVCAKHKKLYFQSSGWEVTAYRDLTGRHDADGNLLPGAPRVPWYDSNKDRPEKTDKPIAAPKATTAAATAPATDMRFSG